MSIDPRVVASLITEDPDVFSEGYPPNKEYGRNSETRRKVFELMGVNSLRELKGKWVFIRKNDENKVHGPYKIYQCYAEKVVLSRSDGIRRTSAFQKNRLDNGLGYDRALKGLHWLSFLKYATPLEKHVEGNDMIQDYSFDELD